jgi:chromosomal replication initiation ATPase DnaA
MLKPAITLLDLVVNVDRGTIFNRRKGGHVVEQSIPNRFQNPGLETKVAIVLKIAEQMKVTLPTDVALYIAQNRSNALALQGALTRLLAHSSLTGTEITLTYTRQVLKNFIEPQARNVTVESVRELLSQRFGMREAKIRRQDPTAADRHFVCCVLEVNMRERERECLARRDAYERDLERRTKKRKQR